MVFNGISPSVSSDGVQIVFCGVNAKSSDLYSVRLDGQGLTQLTNTPFWEKYTLCTPAGILFVSDEHSRGGELYLMPTGSTKAKRICPGLDFDSDAYPLNETVVRLSPQGKQIVFSANAPDASRGVFVCNVDGSVLRRVNPVGSSGFSPVFFNDGHTIAYTDLAHHVEGQRYVLSVCSVNDDGTDRRTLTQDGVDRFVIGTTRGADDLMLYCGPLSNRGSLWRCRRDGTGLVQFSGDYPVLAPLFSARQEAVVFGYSADPRAFEYDLFRVDARAGAVAKRLTHLTAYIGECCLTDDERTVVFTADKAHAPNQGLGQIYRVPIDGGEPTAIINVDFRN